MSDNERVEPADTLIVDDVERLRRLVADALRETESFRVIGEAADGREAIEFVEDREPDLVLLDLSMPRMDGLEALAEIRRRVPGVDVVVLSGFTSQRMEALVEDHGALAYLEKGIGADQLVRRLRTLVQDGAVSPTEVPDESKPEGPEQTSCHVHVVGLDASAAKWIADSVYEARPGWYVSHGETPAMASHPSTPPHVIVAAAGDCRGECADALRSLTARNPEIPVVLAVRGVPEGCLQAALEADATHVVDLETADDANLVAQLQWAIHAEERRRSRTRRLEMLAGTMAHDLRGPLRAIDRYAGWIEQGLQEGDRERTEEALEGIEGGVERARRLIEAQLDYARVQIEPPAAGSSDPEQAVEEALADLEEAIECSGATVTVGELPSVVSPAEHLVTLFRNLVSNAIKYREDGQKPSIEITGETQGKRALLRVSDDGVGIDPEHQDEIFDPFSRLHAEQDYEGTGLGLAICREIVEQWEGRIRVDSQPGEGTTMTVELPRPASG